MDQADIAVTRTIRGVVSAATLVPKRESGYRSLGSSTCHCKGVVKAVEALQTGRRQPNGRARDLEKRALDALPQRFQTRWMKTHLTRAAVEQGLVTADDLFGNGDFGHCGTCPLEPACPESDSGKPGLHAVL
eukprot:4519266-Amphidinium_carterae.1